MKFRNILNEYFQKEHANRKYLKVSYLLAIIPAVIFASYVPTVMPITNFVSIIFLVIVTVAVYCMSAMVGIFCIIGYSGFEVVKPRVNDGISHLKDVIDSPKKIKKIEQILDKVDLETDQRYSVNFTEIKKLLLDIHESQKDLQTKKVGEVFTEIFQSLNDLKEKNDLVLKLQLKVQTLSANVTELTEEVRQLKDGKYR